MLEDITETIVAVSTAAGSSRRAIVRLSGPQAVALVAKRFRADEHADLGEARAWTRHRGQFEIDRGFPKGLCVPACVQVFNAPVSYTRQDVVEVHTLGSPPVLSMIVESLLNDGARAAEPGEFTARAFFAGAMDLTEVEGVAAIIRARSDAQLRAAEKLLHGNLSTELAGLREALVDLLALVEADLDFAEEPIDLITPAELRRRIDAILRTLASLLSSAGASERLDTLPTVLLTGPPNAGKSTLLNRLTNLDRAICTPLAGTTRDVLTAPMHLDAGEVLLVDAAGFGLETCEYEIDRRAIEALRRTWQHADLVLLVVDASIPIDPDVVDRLPTMPQPPALIVANKCDLAGPEKISKFFFDLERTFDRPVKTVSAALGTGCDTLKKWISENFFPSSSWAGQSTLLLNNRHHQNLRACIASIRRAGRLIERIAATSQRTDLIAFELREALEELELLAGKTTNEQILGKIFGQFCIGK